ncbi:gastric triacylglycerol lipase-like isoform X3 [Daphnia pulicaria]|uniref:gastric triacylglycerol lipase-like isoform X3 n=1 Tax=Daphnia pulicaria TaxID=35523 RepID=UPI001EEA06AC|nr:gastric triacylglycerol lipase-like isoform X3 [Daphnia pulicaria]
MICWMASWGSHLGFPLIIILVLVIGEKLLLPKLDSSELDNKERYMTTAEIIRNRGYPLEIHHVVTEDGYILELHRIPSGRNGISANRSRPIFLQHGLLWNDFAWLMNPTNNSLAFILADRGFDVWMGNSRGNSNSRRHVSLDPEKEEYWKFSWDEMGRHDIPACIEYVLDVTEQKKLAAYVGYSLGCTLFFIGAINKPKVNDQVDLMIGLGATSIFHSNDSFSSNLLKMFCDSSQFAAELCLHLLFLIFGYSESHYESSLNAILGHYPDGSSVGAAIQFLQNSISGESFNHFDYGCYENLKRYGSCTPAQYNLSLVTAPVYLISGDRDPIAPPKDIMWLASKLGNLKSSIQVDSSFTHGDFIWSTRAMELVYLPLIRLLPMPYLNSSNTTTSSIFPVAMYIFYQWLQNLIPDVKKRTSEDTVSSSYQKTFSRIGKTRRFKLKFKRFAR